MWSECDIQHNTQKKTETYSTDEDDLIKHHQILSSIKKKAELC
jgi:hypothetical protein